MKKTIFGLVLAFLFSLVACTTTLCSHEFSDWTIVKEATCAETGLKERVCSKCGGKETVEIEKTTAHTFGEWTVSKAASCGTKGEEKRVCSVCSKEETREIAALEHVYGEWTNVKAATCADEGVDERVCTLCQNKEKRTVAKLTEHTFGEWTIVTKADKGVAGLEERVCSVCGKKETQEVPDTNVYSDENWAVSGDDLCAYQYVDSTIVNRNTEVMTNENHYDVGHVNMNIYQTTPAEFYNMSVKIKGTITGTLTGDNDVYAGLLLNYIDENNYFAFIVRWTTWDRAYEMRSAYFIKVENGIYTNLGDNWTDGCAITPGSALNISVVKSLNLNGVVYTVTLSAKAGTWTKECSTTCEYGVTGKVGLVGANDKFVYSEFKVEENTNVVKTTSYTCESDTLTLNYYDGTYELTGSKASNGTYVLSGKNVTLTPSEGEEIIATLKNDNTFEYYVEPSYTIEYTLQAGEEKTIIESTTSDYTISLGYIGTKATGFTTEDRVGVKVWYVDENNYLEAFIQWGEIRSGHDEVRELSIEGKIDGVALAWDDFWADNFTNLPCDGGILTVSKAGNTFTITMTYNQSVKTGSRTIDNLPSGAFAIKAYASGTDFSFYNVTVELNAGNSLELSQITGDFEVEFDGPGTIVSSVTGDVQIGFEMWSNEDNYLRVYTNWQSNDRPYEIRNLEICGKMNKENAGGKEWNDTWTNDCGIHPGDKIHYLFKRVGNVFTLTITCGEYTTTATLDVTNFNSEVSYTTKLYVNGDNFKLTKFTVK